MTDWKTDMIEEFGYDSRSFLAGVAAQRAEFLVELEIAIRNWEGEPGCQCCMGNNKVILEELKKVMKQT